MPDCDTPHSDSLQAQEPEEEVSPPACSGLEVTESRRLLKEMPCIRLIHDRGEAPVPFPLPSARRRV